MHKKNGRPLEAPAAHWALALGDARHVRDDDTARATKSKAKEDTQTIATSIARWAGVVAAMRELTEAYNSGARRVVLNLVEQSRPPTVTVAAAGEGTPSLTAVLEGTCIRLQARDAGSVPCDSEIRLHHDRDDHATAAYILQNWMQRL